MGVLHWVAFGLCAVAWACDIVGVADGPYAGWFKDDLGFGSSTVRYGWKGYSICDGDYKNCADGVEYADNVCFLDAARAAAAFCILAILVGFPVLVAVLLLGLGKLPAQIKPLILVIAAAVASFFSMLAWVVLVGKVNDCTTARPDYDHNPPLLIVAWLFWAIAAVLVFRAPAGAK